MTKQLESETLQHNMTKQLESQTLQHNMTKQLESETLQHNMTKQLESETLQHMVKQRLDMNTTSATILSEVPKAVNQYTPNTHIISKSSKSGIRSKRNKIVYICVIVGVVLVTMIALCIYYYKKNKVKNYEFLTQTQNKIHLPNFNNMRITYNI